jgi:uncharacterized protein YdbL (DUF1318 family)
MPLWLVACVTINVYFPAAAAEKAADRIIKDVYGEQPDKNKPKDGQSMNTAGANYLAVHTDKTGDTVLGRLLDLVIPPAQAAADINISSPAIRSLTGSMASRQQQLNAYYRSGSIGLTSGGLITIRDPGAVPLKERNTLKQLVAADNRDRNALYREIAKANGHPEWEQEIRSTFARRWVANAPSGWWYQDNSGNWRQK